MKDCYVCHGNRIQTHRDLEGFMHLICKDCHFMRLYPSHQVTSASLYTDSYFNGQLFSQTDGKIGYSDLDLDKGKNHRYNHYVDEVIAYCGVKSPKILDVGCGYGNFLKVLSRNNVKVYGIEVDPVVCARASSELCGAPVYCVDLKTDGKIVPRHYFDVITLLDVLEHLDDPAVYLETLAECTTSDGLLFLTTPNIESLNAKIYQDKWILHGAPYHVTYFGPKSLSLLLARTGWKMIDIETEQTIFHNERHGLETWKGRLANTLFQPVDFLTNGFLKLGSIMRVVARRSGGVYS